MSRRTSKTYSQHMTAKKRFVTGMGAYRCELVDISRTPGMAEQNLSYNMFIRTGSRLTNLPKNKTIKLTFRTDRRMQESGNVFVEISHRWPDGHTEDGWFYTCSADCIAYMNEMTGNVFFLDWPKMKDMVDEGYVGRMKDVVNSEDGCTTTVCLVKLDEAEKMGLVLESVTLPN